MGKMGKVVRRNGRAAERMEKELGGGEGEGWKSSWNDEKVAEKAVKQ